MSEGKPFLIEGADGQTISVPAGEYYFNTKARARRMMQNSLSPEARRVYACLELATMGFQQELAVIAIGKDKTRPITRSDIAKQTGFSEPHVRRGLVELEDAGLAERRGTDDGPLHKGKVEIYSWADPRTPKLKNGSQRAAPIPKWFPESWDPLKTRIKRLKLSVSIDKGAALDSLMEEGATKARNLEIAEKEADEFLAIICARRNGPDGPAGNGGSAPPENAPENGVSALQNGVSALQNGVSAAPENVRIREITERTEINIKTASGGRADTVPEKPPARPPDPPSKNTTPSPTEENLRSYLLKCPIKTPLDEPMFARISALIPDQETLQRFQAVANDVKNPRKWAVYESVARQVHERGPTNGHAAPMAGGIDMMEVARQVEELKAKGRRIRNG